jgi:hypothetical protein
MNRIVILSMGLGLVGLLSLTAVGEAQHDSGTHDQGGGW